MNPYQPTECEPEGQPTGIDRRCWWIGTWEDVRNGGLILVGVAVVGLIGSVAIPPSIDSHGDRFAAQCLGAFLAIVGTGVLLGVLAIGFCLSCILWCLIHLIAKRFRNG